MGDGRETFKGRILTDESEPFVQIASWGRGTFDPMMKVSSTGFTLVGEQLDGLEAKAIRTRLGDLAIAPAAGERQ